MERLLRGAEAVAYWLVIAPLAALLPASLAYRIACWRGDWCLRYRAEKRSEIMRNLRLVLGDELGQDKADHLAREFFRMTSCEAIDVMRLRGKARSLGKLVEIRGREHLDAAVAAGKGAICAPPTSVHAAAPSPCSMPAGTRSPPSAAPTASTKLTCLPPSDGSGISS